MDYRERLLLFLQSASKHNKNKIIQPFFSPSLTCAVSSCRILAHWPLGIPCYWNWWFLPKFISSMTSCQESHTNVTLCNSIPFCPSNKLFPSRETDTLSQVFISCRLIHASWSSNGDWRLKYTIHPTTTEKAHLHIAIPLTGRKLVLSGNLPQIIWERPVRQELWNHWSPERCHGSSTMKAAARFSRTNRVHSPF